MKEKIYIMVKSISFMCLIVSSIALGNYLGGIGNYFFYSIIYCIVISICIPIYYFKKEGNGDTSFLGIKKLRIVDYLIIVGFVAFSVGGSLKKINLTEINFSLLPLSVVPLLLSTFSEEFFFRGFLQIRFDRAFGAIPAIIFSGLTFSLYHLGYPGFRTIGSITLMFFVGILFALPFKLSKNNVIVSYFINLPNAFTTYLLKTQLFPQKNFTYQTTIITIFLIFITGFIVVKALFSKPNRFLNY